MTQLRTFVLFASAISILASCSPDVRNVFRDGFTQPKPLRGNALIRYQYAPGELAALCDGAIETLRKGLNAPENGLVFENQLADFSDASSQLTFMGYVSTDASIRDEASGCEGKQGQVYAEIFTRRDLYEIVKNTKPTNSQEARLILQHTRAFEKNGMALSDEKLNEFCEMKKQLTLLESEFNKNLNEDTTKVEFTKEELAGLREEFINNHTTTPDGKFILTTKSTDYTEVMDNAENPKTRQRMLFAYEHRAGEKNSKLINDAVALRAKLAVVLGLPTWADYRIQGRMAKSSKEVSDLLESLKVKLQPRLQKDFGLLLDAKKSMEDPNATALKAEDIRYFSNQVKKNQFSVDDNIIRDYFPKDVVMKGLFEVYSKLLGVTYHEVINADVWAEDVKLYEIREASDGTLLAYFFADFVPRDGKYGHAAAFTLLNGRVTADGTYSKPIASIVANFTPPANGKPSLLIHREVETLFHEFGHIMHQTLTRAPYASLSGANVPQDFVEAPSQMLENWVWNSQVLEMISGHYTDSSKKLPKELVEKMVAAQDFNTGYLYSRQLVFGITDMKIHTESTVEANAAYRQTHLDVMGVPTVDDSQFMASFGHMMGGYDAGYYGYIWSEVHAEDMFTVFDKNGLLDPTTGGRYRKLILESGDMVDSYELLTQFLEREPSPDAFLKKLGIQNGK